MASGKCPKCGRIMAHVKVEPIELQSARGKGNGVCFMCPHCQNVLSVSPTAASLASGIVKVMGRQKAT